MLCSLEPCLNLYRFLNEVQKFRGGGKSSLGYPEYIYINKLMLNRSKPKHTETSFIQFGSNLEQFQIGKIPNIPNFTDL